MRLNNTLKKQHGLTLIEILVALVVGLLLLSAAAAIGLSSLSSNKDSVINGNTQQQLQIVMSTLTRELRRAGYSFTEETSQTAKGFRNIKFFDQDADGNNDCVIFRYDKNPSLNALIPPGNGNDVETNEVRGLRLNNNQIELITAATTATLNTTTPSSCSNAAETWTPLSNSSLNVTQLIFTPSNIMLLDASVIVDQVLITITATSNTTPPHTLNLSEVIQLRNRPYSNN